MQGPHGEAGYREEHLKRPAGNPGEGESGEGLPVEILSDSTAVSLTDQQCFIFNAEDEIFEFELKVEQIRLTSEPRHFMERHKPVIQHLMCDFCED